MARTLTLEEFDARNAPAPRTLTLEEFDEREAVPAGPRRAFEPFPEAVLGPTQPFAPPPEVAAAPNLPRPGEPESTAFETFIETFRSVPDMAKQSIGGFMQALPSMAPPPDPSTLLIAPKAFEAAKESFDAAQRGEQGEIGKWAGRIANEAADSLAANHPNVDPESLKGYAFDIGQNILRMVPAVGVSFATGSPGLGLSIMGLDVYGRSFNEARRDGRTPAEANLDAMFNTLAETIPERIPLGILMKSGGSFVPRVLKTMGAETVQEEITEALQIGYDTGVLDKDVTWGEALQRMKRAGIVGAGVGGGLAVATAPFVPTGPPDASGPPPRVEPYLEPRTAGPDTILELTEPTTPAPPPAPSAGPVPQAPQGAVPPATDPTAVSPARPQVLPEGAYPAPSAEPSMAFVEHAIREPGGTATGPGRPGVRAEPFQPRILTLEEFDAHEASQEPEASPAAPKPRKRPVRQKPLTLAEFLALNGGVKDETGELTAMDAQLWHHPRQGGKPFRRRLVHEGGLSPDYAREAAAEAGYLPMDSDLGDFYTALDRDLRDANVYSDQDTGAVEDQRVKDVAAAQRDQMHDAALGLGIPQESIDRLDDFDLSLAVSREMEVRAEQGPQGDLDADAVDEYIDRDLEDQPDDTSDFESRTFAASAPVSEADAEATEPLGESQEAYAGSDRDAGDRGTDAGAGAAEPTPDLTPPAEPATDGSPEYEAAYQKATVATKKFARFEEAYRTRLASDEEFLAAKAEHDAAQEEFDAAFAAEQKRKQPTTEQTDQGEQFVMPGAEAKPATHEEVMGLKAGDVVRVGGIVPPYTVGSPQLQGQASEGTVFTIDRANGRVLTGRDKGRKSAAVDTANRQVYILRRAEREQADMDKGLFDAEGRKQTDIEEKPSERAEPQDRTPQTTGKIEDFGEVLEGARKHYAQSLADTLGDKDIDVTTEPLSKSFPQPDYGKLAEDGVSGKVLAYVAIMRDTIPNKPRSGWKVTRWAEQVGTLRSFAQKLLSGDIDITEVEKRLTVIHALRDLPLTSQAIEGVDPNDMPKAAQYRVSSGDYSMLNGKKYSPSKTFWFLQGPKRRSVRNPFSNDPAMSSTYRESPEEAIKLAQEIIPHMIAQKGADPGPQGKSKYTKVNVYTDRSSKEIFLGFKVRSTVLRLKSGFEGVPAAREYLEENRDEIQEKIDEMRAGPTMRGAENRPRSGASLREGDVTPEMFTDTFGFRGTQFGNYVEGKRRQADLNRAYDALMDLADVLDIPTQALSLNGSLGLAFGARGRGGKRAAAAHYEPGSVVINLTKGSGAGSLAHEWLHAVDNYFARQDEAGGYMSDRQRDSGPVRDEVYQAWKEVEKAIAGGPFAERSAEFDKPRSKPYWNTTIEKAARAFERYIVDRLSEKGAINDYLANIDMEGGAYPNAEEMDGGIRAAYDKLFETIEHRETDQGTVELHAGVHLPSLKKEWHRAAEEIIDWLATGTYSPFANRFLKGYPWRDPTMADLEQRSEYLDMRQILQGTIGRVERVAGRLNKVLRKASAEDQAMAYEYLTTRGVDPSSLPPRIRGATVTAKSSIKKLGRHLVREGMISQESYEALADTYLPRVYLKHLLEHTDFGVGLKASDMGYTNPRIEDLPEEYKEYLGEIKDVPFLVTKALSLPARDMAILHFLRDVSQNPAWVLQQSLVEWTAPGMQTARKVTPYWLRAQAVAFRRRIRSMPATEQERLGAIADDMDNIADEGLAERGGVPKDFREMPNSPRYGDLRGLVVRKEIYDDIVGQGGILIGEKGTYDKTFDKLAKFNAFFKKMKVPFNPPTQVRNFVSNGVLLDISGVPVERLPILYAHAFTQIIRGMAAEQPAGSKIRAKIGKQGKYYRIAVRHGVRASTFTAAELRNIEPDILRVRAGQGGPMEKIYKMGEIIARLSEKPGDIYQLSETLGKMVKIMDVMEREGGSEAAAVAAANEALFDYSLVPNLVKSLRSRAIGAPFITFYFKAFPAVLKGAIKHPGKMAKYYILPYLLGDMLLASLKDVDEDDVEKLRKALPQWMQDQGHVYIYPYKDASGRWAFANYGYFLPWTMHERTIRNAMEVATGEYEGSVNDFMTELGVLGGPVPQIGAAMMTGIDPWTGREIIKDTDPPKEQLYKLLMYAWRMGAPSWLTDQGVVGHMQRSLTQTPNYYGDAPMSPEQAAGRMVGINIYPTDPVQSRQRNIRRKVYEIERTRRDAKRSLKNRGLDSEKRADLRNQYRGQIKQLMDDLKRYRAVSQVHPRLR